MAIAYISLGSNLDHPPRQLQRALRALCALPRQRLLAVSRRYRNAAVGPGRQADYANAVAVVSTHLKPLGLLRTMQRIERRHGRTDDMHDYTARTLDLDLLLYNALRSRGGALRLPHPQLRRRRFALQPLIDVSPALRLPGQCTAAARLRHSAPHSMRRLWPDARRRSRRWTTPDATGWSTPS